LSIKGTTLKESCVNHRPNQQTEKTNYWVGENVQSPNCKRMSTQNT
jgi:hypothetical protein